MHIAGARRVVKRGRGAGTDAARALERFVAAIFGSTPRARPAAAAPDPARAPPSLMSARREGLRCAGARRSSRAAATAHSLSLFLLSGSFFFAPALGVGPAALGGYVDGSAAGLCALQTSVFSVASDRPRMRVTGASYRGPRCLTQSSDLWPLAK